MKILTLSYEFPPLGGGGSKVVQGVSREYERMGHQVDVVTLAYKDLPRLETVDGVTVHRVPCLRSAVDLCHPQEQASYMLSALPKAVRLARQGDYDVMHCHFILPDGVVALLAGMLKRMPLVVTAHGSDVPGYNPDRFKLLHRLISPAWRAVARSIDRIAWPSRYLESLILEHEPRARTVNIPNGFDTGRLSPGEYRDGSILVVTRMLERKGVQDVIRAVAGSQLTRELHIVGTGPYLPSLKELAESLAVPARFHGWLDNDSAELKSLFEQSSIFVFPSHAENFPLVLLEAMAAGMAIITTNQTGCQEVVGDAALLVSPGDAPAIRNALEVLVNDDEQCRRLGRAARMRLEEHFSWPAVANLYLDEFRDLISSGQAPDQTSSRTPEQ